jgi:hypothetical protein
MGCLFNSRLTLRQVPWNQYHVGVFVFVIGMNSLGNGETIFRFTRAVSTILLIQLSTYVKLNRPNEESYSKAPEQWLSRDIFKIYENIFYFRNIFKNIPLKLYFIIKNNKIILNF